MNPAQPNVSDTRELCFQALEQAYADSLAMQDSMQKQINGLLHGFQQLEELMQAEKITSPSPKIRPTDFTPIRVTPTGQPPPPVLPSKYDGNCFKGQAFLTSFQTYIHLCPDTFLGDHIKITWALSYMKSRQAAKWAERIFLWEEEHEGYSKFLDWEEFRKEFQKDFCPAHTDVVAINKLESTSYYQKSRSVDNYLDEFVDLIVEVGYTDPKSTVVKFQKGLDPQIQNTITTMAYGCPSDASPEDWYEVAKNVDQNRTANEAFKLAWAHSSSFNYYSGLHNFTKYFPSAGSRTCSANFRQSHINRYQWRPTEESNLSNLLLMPPTRS